MTPLHSGALAGRTVLFLVTEDWYFCSHRLPIARAARDAGARVVVAARMARHREVIEREGFVAHPLPFERSSLDPRHDFQSVRAIVGAYRRFRPDLVHHVALKPVLYGTLAAWLTRVPAVVNAMAGLGHVFASKGGRLGALRAVVSRALRLANRGARTRLIVQNDDDRRVFVERIGVTPERIALIRGSGVDLRHFVPTPEPDADPPIAVCVSRMLWSKGIGELVEAARLLRARGTALQVRLVGGTDLNPTSVPEATLDAWARAGIVEVVGHSDDIPGVYRNAHIAVLPSTYGEGVPKSLLEAAACGRPIIATDAPGCRDVCREGETGILVPPNDPARLADALEELAGDARRRHRFGAAARALVERSFGDQAVAAATLALYAELLADAQATP
ncbi:MAG: glycosyltransferase family 4 protein [Pseudomonadota bacterium]